MKLEEYRKLRRLTREQAAKELDVDPATLWRWEKGRTPRPEHIRRIWAWSMGAVTAADLVGEGVRS